MAVRGRPRAGAGGWSGCSRPGRESSRCCPGARLGRRRRLRRADHRGPVRRRPLLAAGHRRPGAARPGRAGGGGARVRRPPPPQPGQQVEAWAFGVRSDGSRDQQQLLLPGSPLTTPDGYLAPGVVHQATADPAGPFAVNLVTVELAPSRIDIALALDVLPGQETTSSMARRRGAVARSGSAPTAGPRRPTRWRPSASWAGRSRRHGGAVDPGVRGRRPCPGRPGPGRSGHRGLVLRHLVGDPGDQRRQPHPGPQRPGPERQRRRDHPLPPPQPPDRRRGHRRRQAADGDRRRPPAWPQRRHEPARAGRWLAAQGAG